MVNIMGNLKQTIDGMINRLGIEIKNYSKEEMDKIELEEEIKQIEPYILKKFGSVFKDAKTLDQFSFDNKTKLKIRDFVKNKDKTFLLLRGGTGTAKTCVAKIIFEYKLKTLTEKLKRFVYATNCIEYIRALDFFDELKNQFNDSQAITQFINYHSNLSLFIIDEVGATYGTENEKIQFNRLIDNFYSKGKSKVILISNLMENEELEKYISKPSFSRICEKGYIINFNGIDYRKTKKDEINQN